jgi:5-methylcytosine-specific restriction endonuclease McrA
MPRWQVSPEGKLEPYGTRWRDRHQPSAAQLAARAHRNTAAWRRARAAQLARQPWCSTCPATTDLTVDHIIPLAQGGTDDPSNLRTLCRRCNGRRAQRDQMRDHGGER